MTHHPECPCCLYARELAHARRAVSGLRASRVRDELILGVLKDDGYRQAVIEDALDSEDDLTNVSVGAVLPMAAPPSILATDAQV